MRVVSVRPGGMLELMTRSGGAVMTYRAELRPRQTAEPVEVKEWPASTLESIDGAYVSLESAGEYDLLLYPEIGAGGWIQVRLKIGEHVETFTLTKPGVVNYKIFVLSGPA